MKNLTKKDVYVKIDKSNVAEVAKLLDSVGEELVSLKGCLKGYLGGGEVMTHTENFGNWARVTREDENLKGKTEVSLEELAEILGVKQKFKVGDRVRCIHGVKSGYKGVGWKEGYEFIVGTVRDTSSGICVFPDKGSSGVYVPFLELVESGKETAIETVTISRANLGRLYPIVCSSWQSYITYLLDDAGSFVVEVQVPLEKLRQAYKEANNKQKAILIEVAHLPKVKSTVKISKWMNVYGNGEGSVFNTKEEALRSKYIGYVVTIELTGEYTTEVEDPLMVNTNDLDNLF